MPTSDLLLSSQNAADLPSNSRNEGLETAWTSQHAPNRTRLKWKFRMRPDDDDEAQDWWFASTAIPLLAATTGPLANVMSIAALITPWRTKYDTGFVGVDTHTTGYADPRWCIALNVASLVCGFAGNIFLLFNFTRRIRCKSLFKLSSAMDPECFLDIVALPMTIVLWYFATGIVS